MRPATVIAWLPVLLLPIAVIVATPAAWPRWAFMWLLAGSIFAGCKWLTWSLLPDKGGLGRQLGYLFLWPGLDADGFFHKPNPRMPERGEWYFAFAKLTLGVVLIGVVFARIPTDMELARGLVGMVGIAFVLHFGVFHLMSMAWRACGVSARPIMDWPIRATSVSDFWGRRWNTAFRDLTHRFLFRPFATKLGASGAMLVGFLFSGLIHDLVISLPAGGGFGGPTAYFLLQPVALFLERSALGRRLGLAHGPRGWAFTMIVLLAPVPLLFHPPFTREVLVPFLDALTHEGRLP